MENNSSNLFDLQIDQESTSLLQSAAKWGKFLAIVGFVLCGLILIAAIFAGSILSAAFSRMGSAESSSALGGAVSFLYVGVALLYFFPCLYLYNFSKQIQAALNGNDQALLNRSFKNLRAMFRFVGILTIVVLSIYALIIIFAVIAGASSRI